MPFRISVTNPALDDMDSVVAWYGLQHLPDFGRRWRRGVETAVDSLSENPDRCGLAHESDDFDFELRELLYGVSRKKTHRILFRIVEETVEILAVRHVAQQNFSSDES